MSLPPRYYTAMQAVSHEYADWPQSRLALIKLPDTA